MSFSLLAWRRTVAALYADVRATAEDEPLESLARFREGKDRLFRTHADSPIPPSARSEFDGLRYWPYEPSLRFVVPVVRGEGRDRSAPSLAGEAFPLRLLGSVRLPLGVLEVYWLDTYGGGIFLPFRDATSGRETYGGGRYLLDTIKGADLGGDDAGLVLDFNYAYHPSCAYDPAWVCPLAPRANRLASAVRAGERLAAEGVD